MSLERTSEWPGFTPEGYAIYEKAVQQIRTALANGHSYDQACATLHNLATGIRDFIRDDFLKILLAEEHLGNGIAIDDLALTLGLPYERIKAAMAGLIREINRAAILDFPPMASTMTH
jgi:hypothetical protein